MTYFATALLTDDPSNENIEKIMAPYSPYTFEDHKKIVNPNAQLDSYAIGGSFTGLIPIKEEKKDKYASNRSVDIVKIKDIDLSLDPIIYQQAIRFWEIQIENQEPKEGEAVPVMFCTEEFYTDRYPTKEDFATCMSLFLPFFAISPENGEWLQFGIEGWLGIDESTGEQQKLAFQQFSQLLGRHPEKYLVLIDVQRKILS